MAAPSPSPDESNCYLGDALREDLSTPAATNGLLIFVLCALAAAFIFWLGVHAAARATQPAPIGPFVGESASIQTPTLVVHVAGEVKKPGVYELPLQARVRDAVQKAGGPTSQGDVNAINLAAFAEDGSKIEVPAKVKIAAPLPTLPEGTLESTPLPTAPEPEPTPIPLPEYSPPIQGDAAGDAAHATSSPAMRERRPKNLEATTKPKPPKVLPQVPRALTKSGTESEKADPVYLQKHPLNLNTASAAELELLPGVGPAMAQKILAARGAKGGFKSVDELDDVPGIGEKKLEKLRPLVTAH